MYYLIIFFQRKHNNTNMKISSRFVIHAHKIKLQLIPVRLLWFEAKNNILKTAKFL